MERICRSVVRWFESPKVRCAARSLLLFAATIETIVAIVLFWDFLQENSETLRNISLVFASLIGLPLLGWRGITAYRQANISQGQADTAQQSLLNERYQKGAEMLGNSALAVRMGGIYALQRLTEDHPKQFYIQMMELLCAFVRLPTEDKNLKQRQMEDEGKHDKASLSVREDVQAVIVAIGSLRKTGKELEKDDFKLNLQRAHLRSGDFPGVNLSGANLSGANLSRAHLTQICPTQAQMGHGGKSVRRISIQLRKSIGATQFSTKQICPTQFSTGQICPAHFSSTQICPAQFSKGQICPAHFFPWQISPAHFFSSQICPAQFSGRQICPAQLSSKRICSDADSDAKAIRFTSANLPDPGSILWTRRSR